jgi:hypothetical protein
MSRANIDRDLYIREAREQLRQAQEQPRQIDPEPLPEPPPPDPALPEAIFGRRRSARAVYRDLSPPEEYSAIYTNTNQKKDNMTYWSLPDPQTGEKLIEITDKLEVKIHPKLNQIEAAAAFWDNIRDYLPREINNALRDKRLAVISYIAIKSSREAENQDEKDKAKALLAEVEQELADSFY